MTRSFDSFLTKYLNETVGLQAPAMAPQPQKPSVPQPPQQQTTGNNVEEEFLKLLQTGKVNPNTLELLKKALEQANGTNQQNPASNATNQQQPTQNQQTNTVK